MQTSMMTSLVTMAADVAELGADAAGAATEKAGLPQFDPANFAPQIVWLVITFAVFYFIMSRFVLPKIGDVLEDREERIADDLDQAQQLSEEATSVQDTFEGSLTEARAKSMEMIAAARAEAQAQIDAEMATLDEKLTAQSDKAEERIAEEKAASMTELEAVATDACNDIIGKLLGTKIDGRTVKAAVKAEISGKSA